LIARHPDLLLRFLEAHPAGAALLHGAALSLHR
jgi:hypothetical protein